jgi:protein-tyrosine phosphatase
MPFAAIVDLTAEFTLRDAPSHYANVPMLDLATPTPAALAAAGAAIERLRTHGPVLVCCALGYSRSACAAAAWLLASGRAPTVDDALARVRSARAQIVLRPRHLDALRALPAPAPG